MKRFELGELRAADAARCDKAALTDLREINIPDEGSTEERLLSFLERVQNPYLFKVGDIAVKVDHLGEKSLSELMANALKAS